MSDFSRYQNTHRKYRKTFRNFQSANSTNPRCHIPRKSNSHKYYCPAMPMLACSPNSCTVSLDDEENFIDSLLPYIRALPDNKKMQLRVLFQEVLSKAMDVSEKSKCDLREPAYCPSRSVCSLNFDDRFFWSLIPFIKMLEPGMRLEVRLAFSRYLQKVFNKDEVEPLSELLKDKEEIGATFVNALARPVPPVRCCCCCKTAAVLAQLAQEEKKLRKRECKCLKCESLAPVEEKTTTEKLESILVNSPARNKKTVEMPRGLLQEILKILEQRGLKGEDINTMASEALRLANDAQRGVLTPSLLDALPEHLIERGFKPSDTKLVTNETRRLGREVEKADITAGSVASLVVKLQRKDLNGVDAKLISDIVEELANGSSIASSLYSGLLAKLNERGMHGGEFEDIAFEVKRLADKARQGIVTPYLLEDLSKNLINKGFKDKDAEFAGAQVELLGSAIEKGSLTPSFLADVVKNVKKHGFRKKDVKIIADEVQILGSEIELYSISSLLNELLDTLNQRGYTGQDMELLAGEVERLMNAAKDRRITPPFLDELPAKLKNRGFKEKSVKLLDTELKRLEKAAEEDKITIDSLADLVEKFMHNDLCPVDIQFVADELERFAKAPKKDHPRESDGDSSNKNANRLPEVLKELEKRKAKGQRTPVIAAEIERIANQAEQGNITTPLVALLMRDLKKKGIKQKMRHVIAGDTSLLAHRGANGKIPPPFLADVIQHLENKGVKEKEARIAADEVDRLANKGVNHKMTASLEKIVSKLNKKQFKRKEAELIAITALDEERVKDDGSVDSSLLHELGGSLRQIFPKKNESGVKKTISFHEKSRPDSNLGGKKQTADCLRSYFTSFRFSSKKRDDVGTDSISEWS